MNIFNKNNINEFYGSCLKNNAFFENNLWLHSVEPENKHKWSMVA